MSCRFRGIARNLILFLAAVTASAVAQVVQVTHDVVPPVPGAGYDYVKSLAETVDPQMGTLEVRVGLPMPAGRDMTLPFAFAYNSNLALHYVTVMGGQPVFNWTDNSSYLGRSGWRYVVPSLSLFSGSYFVGPNGGPPGPGGNLKCVFFADYSFTDEQGTQRDMRPPGAFAGMGTFDPSPVCSGPGTPNLGIAGLSATDGTYSASTSQMASGQASPPPVTVTDNDGTLYQFSNPFHYYPGDNQNNVNLGAFSADTPTTLPSLIETRNGNQITITDQGKGIFSITDQLGRSVLSTNGFGGTGGTASDTINVSGFGAYSATWSAPQSFNWPNNSETTLVSPGPDLGHCGPPLTNATGSQPVITQITLANSQAFQFAYDSVTGLLNQITYPNGALVSYTWTANPLSASNTYTVPPSTGSPSNITSICSLLHDTPAVQTRIVKFDGVHAALEQDFSYSTTWGPIEPTTGLRKWTTKKTTVTTKDLVRGTSFQTVYTYTQPVLLSIANFASKSSTTVYSTVDNLPGTGGSLLRTTTKSWSYYTSPPTTETVALDNGQTSEIISCYPIFTAPAPCPSVNVNSLLAILTDRYEYGYGSGQHGPLLRRTHYDYQSFPVNPLGIAIVDRPADVIIYDANNNELAETDYAYDQQTSLASASATKHDDQNFPTTLVAGRGNVTAKTEKCFTGSGSSQRACPQGNSVTAYTYDQTGQMLSKTDPNLNPISYSYTDSFTDAPPAANTNAYLTTITYPKTNGVSHIENFSYEYSDGQLKLYKDENTNKTTYSYNDAFRRLTETDYPDGGQTIIGYHDSGPNPNVVTTKKIDGNTNLVTTAMMDGMGHTIQTQINSDPLGVDYTDTIYDGIGRPLKVSNPHRSAASDTDGVTQSRFDALGRVTDEIKQDGGIVHTDYNGNTTIVIDETGRSRRSVTDAFGRLIEVDEPAAGTPLASPGAVGRASGAISGNEQVVEVPATDLSFSATPGSQSVVQHASTNFTISIAPPSGNGDAMSLSASGLPPGATAVFSPVLVSGSGSSMLTVTTSGSTPTGNFTLTITGDSASYHATTTVNLAVTIDPAVLMAIINNILLSDSPSTAATSSAHTAQSSSSSASSSSLPQAAKTSRGTAAASSPSPIVAPMPAPAAPAASPATRAATANPQTSNVLKKIYDTGTIQITVGGSTATAHYGPGSTAGSVAADLASQFNDSASGSGVSAFVNGSNLNLFANAPGSNGNYSIDRQGSSSNQPQTFAQPSFTISVPGLSGGANPVVPLYPTGTAGSGSITISGSLAVVSTTPGSYATGSVTVSGMEQSTVPPCPPPPQECGNQNTIYDSGSVTITVNGNPDFSAYGQFDTSTTVASGLAQAIANDSNAPVTVSLSGTTISLTSKAAGSGANYSLSSNPSWDSSDFPLSSFTGNTSGSSLTGGRDSSVTYDSGTLTVTVNGFQVSAGYDQNTNSTAAALAQALANALNDPESPVTASVSGATITMTAKGGGPRTDYAVSGSSTRSFTASSTTLSGGAVASGQNAPYVTLYSYDVLGNLTQVDQIGDGSQPDRVRTFSYDSLSRLVKAQNPESGLILYSYDPNGNVVTKTDNRGIIINYSPSDSNIDALNRVTKKTFSNGDPAVTFSYDIAPANPPGTLVNLVGRLVSSSVGNTSEIQNYDAMGQISSQWQCTSLNCGNSSNKWFRQDYNYNLLGEEISHAFNGAFTISESYDSAARLVQVSSSLSDSQHPGTLAKTDPNVGYYPTGALRMINLGNGLTETSAYNNRLQPCRTAVNSSGAVLATCDDATLNGNLVDFSYGFNAGGGDNGNLTSFSATGNQNFNRTYSYDALNRLLSMSAPNDVCSGLSWQYDPWGNRTSQSATGGSCRSFQAPANPQNQLIGYQYDAAGNLTSDGTHSYSYDGEGRIKQVDNGSTASYVYNAAGGRVQKITPSGQINYWLDRDGNTAVEWDQNGNAIADYIYANGGLLAEYRAGGTGFVDHDHLGATRLITGPNQAILDSVDYQPYGEQIAGDTWTTHKFTGKERDSETGLDYFGARHYSSALGRFMTPDWAARPTAVPYAVFGDPQSLNLYNYVRNDPISRIDPDGHYDVNASGCNGNNAAKCQKKYDKAAQRFEQARQKDLHSKDPRVREAAAKYGDPGTKNGVHVGFEDLKSQGIKGSVDPSNSGKDKLIDIEVKVDISLKGKSLQETVAHEGSHVGDDINFLTSYSFATGHYDPAANITHGQTEFNAFQTGAGVTHEHGFGPNDVNKINQFLQNSPTYGPILNVPVFNPNSPDYPQ
jgi:RHS repeat-associated protein